MEYDTHLIGQRIKEARKAKRYTQDYVSAQANIGEKFLSQIECGNAGLSVQTLLSLCNILEVSPTISFFQILPRHWRTALETFCRD